jgi:NhaP-type Na+/H+ or K+/H+ antiporter
MDHLQLLFEGPDRMAPADLRFLHRWQRWRRRGGALYVAWGVVRGGIAAALTLCVTRNLAEYGLSVSLWRALSTWECATVAGVVVAYTSTLLAKFSANEARYERLSKCLRGVDPTAPHAFNQ